jgi:DNA processing protein
MEGLQGWIVLNKIFGSGARFRKLIDRFASSEHVFSASKAELQEIGIPEDLIKKIFDVDEKEVEREIKSIESNGIDVITFEDERYPSNLRAIFDPPPILYLKGKIEKVDSIAISIVGSRTSTYYGRETARTFALQLARCGVTVVSGLARGIDSAAHRGAMDGGGRTIAVLGCGVDVVYPPENKKLYEEIAKSGAIISEFPCGTPPERYNFPIRNRLISGLSLGTVVVEAGLRSGALITAGLALEQGREVFAIPGRISDPLSRGTHRLIREGAKLVENIDHILEEFPSLIHILKEGEKKNSANVDGEERKLYDLLSAEPQHIDSLGEKAGLGVQKISKILLQLELKGLVRQLRGKFFVKV